MNAHQRYMQLRKDELYHFNPNHDPKDGKFTSGKGISGAFSKLKSTFKKKDKASVVWFDSNKLKQDVGDLKDKDPTQLAALNRTVNEAKKQMPAGTVNGDEVKDILTNYGGFVRKDLGDRFSFDTTYFSKKMYVTDSSGTRVNVDISIDQSSPIFKTGTTKKKLLGDLSRIEKDWPKIDESVKKQLSSKIAERGTWVDEENPSSPPLSAKEIANRIGKTGKGETTGASISYYPASDGSRNHGTIYYDDGGLFYGHIFTVEYDFDKDKVERWMIEG